MAQQNFAGMRAVPQLFAGIRGRRSLKPGKLTTRRASRQKRRALAGKTLHQLAAHPPRAPVCRNRVWAGDVGPQQAIPGQTPRQLHAVLTPQIETSAYPKFKDSGK